MAFVSEKNLIPSEILDDLSSRFIVNIPEEEKREPIRLCFQVELAYWFYLDFFCTEDPNLKTCGMKEFTAQIFEHIPFLTPLLKNLDKIIDDWRMYKSSVPTYGAIVLNEDLTKVLLVQSYFAKSSWGFPKGKVNELEIPHNCAVREVFEETGLDISKMIDENDFIEANVNEQTIRLYVVSGVNENVKFQPRTRNEIKNVEWFTITDLPSSKKDMTSRVKIGVGPNSFFMVLPFIKRIRNWIQDRKLESKSTGKQWNGRRHRHKSMGETPSNSSPLQLQSTSAKNKRQNQVPQALEKDFLHYSMEKNPLNSKNTRNTNKQQQNKTNFKRQLFSDDEKHREVRILCDTSDFNNGTTMGPNNNTFNNKHQSRKKMQNQELQFIVPRWLNFKLDKISILNCFDD
ncbi:hypothetical protein RUM43_000126 [Polyplax serrata]|uniref:m7GpppN-mRNA hydrolase n=1 Tax=Polyplax serrata TaxID=468196 RepID=A0AAN8SBZ3_POLSC